MLSGWWPRSSALCPCWNFCLPLLFREANFSGLRLSLIWRHVVWYTGIDILEESARYLHIQNRNTPLTSWTKWCHSETSVLLHSAKFRAINLESYKPSVNITFSRVDKPQMVGFVDRWRHGLSVISEFSLGSSITKRWEWKRLTSSDWKR
jgi:hypothetical protein